VWDRTAVKLSFAHAEGRNYQQLPAGARLREEPSPAEIFYSKRRYAFSWLHVRGEMRFWAREYKPEGHLGSIMRVGGIPPASSSVYAPALSVPQMPLCPRNA
jgi:hypothetical protein